MLVLPQNQLMTSVEVRSESVIDTTELRRVIFENEAVRRQRDGYPIDRRRLFCDTFETRQRVSS